MAGTPAPVPIPTPSLVVLVGAPASGKSTWASEQFRPEQIVSADALRAVVGEHELDLAATGDAFDLLDRIVDARLGRGLTTVIDTTGLDPARRSLYLATAQRHGASAVAVRFTTSAAECRRRNRGRQYPVPAKALDQMLAKARDVDLAAEPWDLVIEPKPVRTVTKKLAPAVAASTAAPAPDTRQLRFGLLVSSFNDLFDDSRGGAKDPAAVGARLAELASDAEAAGFDSLWVMDHMIQIPQVGRAWDPMLDSYTTLGFLAAATTRIKLGVLVTPVTLRHVTSIAKAIATLDVLSGGRAMAGLGAGSSPQEHQALGLPFGSPVERLRLLDESAQALRQLLGPGGAAFEGEHLSIPNTGLYPRPLQERVPLIIGGSGERVTLRIAAEHGDGCNLFGDAATVRRRVDALHEHCDQLGRDRAEVAVTHLGGVLVGSDPNDLRRRIEQLRPADLGPDRFAERVNAGTVADHIAGFGQLADAGVQTAIVTTPGMTLPGALEPFAALTAAFSGSGESAPRSPTRDPQ